MVTRRRILNAACRGALAGAFAGALGATKKKAVQYGVIAGTVFQETGFALPGARITVKPVVREGQKIKKKQIQEVTTDRRGEFAVKVASGGVRYTIEVEADGWQPAEKSVEVNWDQRIEVTFRLQPAAK